MQGGGGPLRKATSVRHCGFTMAEILLSLTIIGVVAAITLPSLTGNINERTWNTQRKALYARMSQAVALMPALNGYGTLTEDADGNITEDTAAETFVTNGLSKVLKINNVCDADHFSDCGFPSKIIGLNNSSWDFPNELKTFNPMMNGSEVLDGMSLSYSMITGKGAAFETQNGESMVVFYNPNCVGDMGESSTYRVQPKMCANFVYDLNGTKGPNTVNKDIGFITVLYPSDSVVVAPVTLYRRVGDRFTWVEAGRACASQSEEGRLPTVHEAMSLFYNKNLLSPNSTGGDAALSHMWTSTSLPSNAEYVWYLDINFGAFSPHEKDSNGAVRCVKRNLN